jgi:hypothetical protein
MIYWASMLVGEIGNIFLGPAHSTMDSVISSLIGSLIEGYFTIIFRNFRKDQFVLSTSTSEASSVLHNLGGPSSFFLQEDFPTSPSHKLPLEINRDVVQEILGLSALNVTKMCINTLTVSVGTTAHECSLDSHFCISDSNHQHTQGTHCSPCGSA